MAEAEAEAAYRSSGQAVKEEELYNDATGDDSGEQIESSDEYDPAQDVQAVPLPGSQATHPSNDSSDNASRSASIQPIHVHHSSLGEAQILASHIPAKSPINDIQENTLNRAQDASQWKNTTMNSPTSTMTKTRLPHDRLGILEDRIKNDEKGDMDAWVSLIGEYKRRGKLDDLRKVYDRFFEVFPQAVSDKPHSVVDK